MGIDFKNMNSGQKKKIATGAVVGLGGLALLWAVATDTQNSVGKPKKVAKQTQVLSAANRNLTLEDLAQQLYATNQRIQQMDMNNQQRIQQMFAQYQPPPQSAALSEDDIRRIIADERVSGSLSDIGNNAFTDPANPQAPLAGIDGMGGEEDEEGREPFKTVVTNPDSLAAAEAKAKAAGKNYLPVGTTISFVSVAGMNAPTNAIANNAAGGELMPTLLRVRGKAILPNKNEYDLQDCVIVASGYGQMADERAILRTDTMSCIQPNGQTTEVAIKGTVFGEDGKPGMRGRMVSMNGKVIAQMVKIGAIQTLGNMLVAGAANYDFKSGREINNNSGVSVNTGNNSGDNMASEVARAGAAGLNDTFNRIAGIYEQYAQQTFPVIEVNPGRKGEVVLTEGIEIDYKGGN